MRPVAALFTDLDERGLLDTTLVVLCGEFSRTPKMNDGGNGGAADEHGHARPRPLGQRDVLPDGRRRRQGRAGRRLDRPPRRAPARRGRSRRANIHATIYHVLGIDPKLQLLDPSGRPVNVLDDPTPIAELL